MGKHTDLIHRGERPAPSGSTALTTPIYETSTFVFDSARDVERYQEGTLSAFLYSRYENPTLVAVEEKLSAVDDAEMSLVFSSGMADLSMQSATKYLNGHSDVTGGVLSGAKTLLEPIGKMRRLLGGVMDPQPAYALSRGLKTLPLRVARHNANAMAVAEFLEGHPAVDRVYYPGLASHPDHEIAKRQMKGFGGMVCVDVKGGQAGAYAVFDRFTVIKRAASLGGVESVCSLPILTSQYGLTDEELAKAGVTRSMMRLSIGLEDPEDLLADLSQALG